MPDYSPSWAGSVPDVKPDADGAEPILDDEILDHVAESQELLPREKETTVRFGKHDDRAIVHTDEAGLARRLLAHPRAAPRFASVEQHADARTVETYLDRATARYGPAVVVRHAPPVDADLKLVDDGDVLAWTELEREAWLDAAREHRDLVPDGVAVPSDAEENL